MTNLSDVLPTLKRFDNDVEEVLASSGHVAMYTMVVESSQWTRRNVEGSLFILKRKSSPRFRLMVLNKLSTENYFEDIHAGLAFEKNPPYLMYTHGNAEIIGVWFYEQGDLSRVEEVLERIKHLQQAHDEEQALAAQAAQGQAAPPAVPPQTHTPPPSRPAPATPPKPAGPPAAKGDDDAFWDKPVTASAQQAAAARAAATGAPPPAPAAPAGDAAASNLANLLRNATLKAQAPQAPAPNAPAGPLPPSFFAQQQQARPQASPVPPSAQQQPPHAMHTLPVHAPQPSPAPPHIVPSPHAAQPQPPAQQMGGALAKLFANAHKAPAPASPAAPPPSGPVRAPHATPPPAAAVQYAAPAAPPAAVANGVSDEEKVRRLLARIATNEGLLKMLAGEMRAVGLL
ncbi:hypothetical protein CHLRE_07g339250v5 [Chlamydomonas reinhardtii]|uniref:WH1 domain-containing protein n=1 Tax=Chlamydomonas reinhardtii TaxID=3055 RepID=A0A2K3DKF3_CHLRE|nr:uncharacterized protein CHLRE_07g339250v5 [Chlamydomonas reinhardtii]PNW81015.1 hypothetical protein CHLRE_07g339250v5 [Chlamydomonas reinhardtii]